jgi:uncharacterized protein YbjT (DUF2867 family)
MLRAVHAGVEQVIENSEVEWTFLCPWSVCTNCVNWWAPQIKAGDAVRWFHADAATAPIHEDNIAGVAVRALCDDGHDGKEYVLTGPESLTQREQLQIVGDAIGRRLRFEEPSPVSARGQLLKMMPPAIADMLLTAYAAAVGRPALVTSDVSDVTGSPAHRFQQWAADHIGAFPSPHR